MIDRKYVIQGLECVSGKSQGDHFRENLRTGKDPCDNCVISHNKKKRETCVRLVCSYALELLQDDPDGGLIDALECLACKKHKEPARNYSRFRSEECSKCRYNRPDHQCTADVAMDALKAIEKTRE